MKPQYSYWITKTMIYTYIGTKGGKTI